MGAAPSRRALIKVSPAGRSRRSRRLLATDHYHALLRCLRCSTTADAPPSGCRASAQEVIDMENEELTWKCKCGNVNRYVELYLPEEMTDEGIASAYWYVQCSKCGKQELI